MSEYSDFSKLQTQEYLCPACGAEISEGVKTAGGWNCPQCGDFIPEDMVIDPFKGLSNQHKMSLLWR